VIYLFLFIYLHNNKNKSIYKLLIFPCVLPIKRKLWV